MADWQVDFYVVPRHAVTARNELPSAALDDFNWWGSAEFPSDYRGLLSELAPPASSTHADLETWGPTDGNRIGVWSEGGHVRSVIVRVDVRRLDSRFGAALLNFVRAADAVLIRRDGLIVEPTIGAYAGALRNSKAWKFASDPIAFFKSQPMTTHDDDV